MHRLFLSVLLISAAYGAENPWARVLHLKSGMELRLYKKNNRQPVAAKLDEAREDKLIVVIKDQQVAIPRDEIDRLDARPAQTKGRFSKEDKTTVVAPERRAPLPGVQGPAVPAVSSSTGVTLNGKPDFETVYRRPAEPMQK